jgi:enterochelin esterase-like enzyme
MPRVHFRIHVPPKCPPVHVAGNHPALGGWHGKGLRAKGRGRLRTLSVEVPEGYPLEYKITLGSFAHERTTPLGCTYRNGHVTVFRDVTVTDHAEAFLGFNIAQPSALRWPIHEPPPLTVWKAVRWRALKGRRRVSIWLPPNYDVEKGRRYPVLYMHDGQNVFEPHRSFAGVDWGADEAVTHQVRSGHIPPVIVVAIDSSRRRLWDYDAFGGIRSYGEFLAHELKPRIDRKFRTMAGREFTATMGSSMGGVASIALGIRHPETFGAVAALSCHWPSRDGRLAHWIERHGFPRSVRAYFDHGTRGADRHYGPLHRRVEAQLRRQGMREGVDYLAHVAHGADHTEGDWRARLGMPLQFLFGPLLR